MRTRWNSGIRLREASTVAAHSTDEASTVAGRSTEEAPAAIRASKVPRAIKPKLDRWERLAVAGALVCALSLTAPWFEISFSDRQDRSGLSQFGFAHVALLVTLGASAVLTFRVGRERRPPLPLHEGTLLAVAGAWAAVIIGFLVLDRPTARISSLPADYGLAYGTFIAFAGALVLLGAGLRIRRVELSDPALRSEAEAPDPTASSQPRSP